MSYYEDYIIRKAEQAFDFDKAEFSRKTPVERAPGYVVGYDKAEFVASDETKQHFFDGAMCEMVSYLFDRRSEAQEERDEECSLGLLFDPENVEVIYISQRELECPVVVVEYEETPEWFTMENAAVRELYWYPNPANSGEWTAAYFQPREGW